MALRTARRVVRRGVAPGASGGNDASSDRVEGSRESRLQFRPRAHDAPVGRSSAGAIRSMRIEPPAYHKLTLARNRKRPARWIEEPKMKTAPPDGYHAR